MTTLFHKITSFSSMNFPLALSSLVTLVDFLMIFPWKPTFLADFTIFSHDFPMIFPWTSPFRSTISQRFLSEASGDRWSASGGTQYPMTLVTMVFKNLVGWWWVRGLYYPLYTGDLYIYIYIKPARIKWNDRVVLNTAHFFLKVTVENISESVENLTLSLVLK